MISWFERHKKLSWVITVLIAVIIFWFSSLDFAGAGISKYNLNWMSIIYHIVIFFFLSIFFFISLIRGEENYKLFFLTVLILIAYGIIDEIHQFFIPGRFCTISDLGFNTVGVLFAFMLKYRKL